MCVGVKQRCGQGKRMWVCVWVCCETHLLSSLKHFAGFGEWDPPDSGFGRDPVDVSAHLEAISTFCTLCGSSNLSFSCSV